MKTIIVLPTYNEAENIPILVKTISALNIADLHLMVIDDNSPDGTGQISEELQKEYGDLILVRHRAKRMGLGSAYRLGFTEALSLGADAIGQMDSDLSHPPEKLPEMIETLKNTDVVIGSRYIEGGSVDQNWPLWRKALSAWGNFYARTILGLPLRDVTGGFRLWSRKALTSMPMERIVSNGYVFQVETAYVANRLGLKLKEVPIYFADRKWGISKMNWRIQVEAAWRVWYALIDFRDL
ncbi:MAG: polyprenol monophosphomannose synthase [Anaerolineae bacterium]|nr:polyprenol monophosphomannose synthase [Anaerolineae bacterium]